MDRRKHKMAKRYKQVKVDDDNFLFVAVFDDLEDRELNDHYRLAIDTDDWDYAQEVHIEANNRGFEIVLRR